MLSIVLILTTLTVSEAQKKKQKRKEQDNVALHFYDGPEQPLDQVAKLVSDDLGKQYTYFISVDDQEVESNSLMSGVKEIFILPGNHQIQMRFVAKGEIAIPIEPFDSLPFKEGTTYQVKFEYTPGSGKSSDYIGVAQSTLIKFWIEEAGEIIMEKLVDGFGRAVDQ